MKTYELYLITNLVNGKRYVGQTNEGRGYLSRFVEHIEIAENDASQHKCYIHHAIKKYGKQNFEVKRLIHGIPDNQINRYEQLWIKKFNTFYLNGRGYNLTQGGSGMLGYRHTAKTKQKLSVTSKHWWETASQKSINERNAKISKALSGRKFFASHCAKISEEAKKRVGSKNPFYGKKHTEETKMKISANNSKRVGMYDKDTEEYIRSFSSIHEAVQFVVDAGKTKNIHADARISKICNGIDRTAYGYIWKFI